MGVDSKIEWTDHTFNPWWGCVRVSSACEHCYAATLARQFGVEWGAKAARRFFGLKHWNEPLRWNAAAIKAGRVDSVFCGSMCDWAEDNPAVADERERMWTRIRETREGLRWLLLTKRADNIAACLPSDWGAGYPNVALGVTAENQEWADRRIPALLQIPARWRFVSVEPMLGAIDFIDTVGRAGLAQLGITTTRRVTDMSGAPLINWVICGGESGPGARPMHPDWARGLRDQCVAAGVSFFFKQWGEWLPGHQYTHELAEFDNADTYSKFRCLDWSECEWLLPDESDEMSGDEVYRVGKARAGRLLDGREWNETPWRVI